MDDHYPAKRRRISHSYVVEDLFECKFFRNTVALISFEPESLFNKNVPKTITFSNEAFKKFRNFFWEHDEITSGDMCDITELF